MIGTNSILWKRMFALLACLTILSFASFSLAQSGKTSAPLVADVQFNGVRSIPTDKLLQYIYTKPGREYSEKVSREDLVRLADSRLCRPVDVRTEPTTDGRVIVMFYIQEFKNVVRDVIYRHVKHSDVKTLENLTRIKPGMPMNKDQNKLACFEIQAHLKKEGYMLANVTLLEGYDDSHEKVVFNITEGPKTRVRQTTFMGQNALATESRLRTQIETSRAFLSSFGGSFSAEAVDMDVTKLKEYYRSNGYLNVNVARELKFSEDYQYVDIIYHIQEGMHYRIANWTVEGTKEFPRDKLASVVTLKEGDYYNEAVINADVRNLTDFGGWRGYPLDVKKNITELPDNPGLIRVQYVVEEKPAAKVGEIIIVGNPVTQDRVIRRVLGLYPGQDLQYPYLKVAEKDLARLNIFETNPELGIRPTVQALDTPGPFKDILVKVQDTRTGSLMLGAGINSDSGLVGSIVLNERNFDILRFPTSWEDVIDGRAFRGAGQELRIEAVPGTVVQRYTVSLREPFLFDAPYSLLTSGYYRDRIFSEYTEGRLGTRMSLSHLFTREWSGTVGFRLEDVNVSNISAGAPVDYTSVYGQHFLVAPNVAVTYDTRDSYVRATEGGKLELSYELAFGAYTFPIINLEGSRYFTLWQRPDGSGKHVLNFHSQVSYAGGNTPVYERFFAGGYNSIRGFEFRGVGPNVDGYMVGGKFQLLNSVEYQIPIRANDQLYAVAFVDSGTVESKVGITNYRVSAGFGLRISLPMLGPVPIALDFGFPIMKSATDNTQLFSFFIGMNR